MYYLCGSTQIELVAIGVFSFSFILNIFIKRNMKKKKWKTCFVRMQLNPSFSVVVVSLTVVIAFVVFFYSPLSRFASNWVRDG